MNNQEVEEVEDSISLSSTESPANEGSLSEEQTNSTEDTTNTTTENPRTSAKNSSARRKVITTTASPFVRSSALGGSNRRRSSRRCRGSRTRQVRFQPIPQAIDISITRSTDESLVSETRERYVNMSSGGLAEDFVTSGASMFQSQLKANLKHHLTGRPFAKKLHHLSHLKFNSIKLKSFNRLAQQIHHSLSSSSASSGKRAKFTATATTSRPSAAGSAQSDQLNGTHNGSTNKTDAQGHEEENHNLNDEDDEFDWGSDFDEQSVGSTDTNEQANAGERDKQAYLLEIGRPSGDQSAIEDVIQDQGCSGQFKRLDSSPGARPIASSSTPVGCEQFSHKLMIELERRQQRQLAAQKVAEEAQEPEVLGGELIQEQEHNEDDEDDEEEMRSLEARQGFRQIRDKLKVILDQRLADFERSAGEQPTQTRSSTTYRQTQETCNTTRAPSAHSPELKKATKSLNQQQQQQQQHHPHSHPHPLAHGQPASEFDCQSHCSDESSGSSGLDSNHSGSQDSGHSTQHSGYSCARLRLAEGACGSPRGRTGKQLAIEAAPSSPSSSASLVSPPLSQTSCTNSIADDSDGSAERRTRFLHNRLLIDRKLESMFRGRTGTSARPETKQEVVSQNEVPNKRSEQRQEEAQQKQHTEDAAAIRRSLLEQQRQMSAQLNQKPRRRCKYSMSSVGDKQKPQNGSYAREVAEPSSSQQTQPQLRQQQEHQLQSLPLIRQTSLSQLETQATFRVDRTKLCRLYGGQVQPVSPYISMEAPAAPSAAMPMGSLVTNKQPLPGAPSLRQLVKDVIDGYEQPRRSGRLSRSGSLSSELVASLPGSPEGEEATQTPPSEHEELAECYLHTQVQHQHGYHHINQHPVQQSTPTHKQQPQQPPADLSLISSVGSTIDGLEFAPNISLNPQELQLPAIGNHQQPAAGKKSAAKHFGSYLRSLRELSKFRLSKAKLSGAAGEISSKPVQRSGMLTESVAVAAAATTLMGGNYAVGYLSDADQRPPKASERRTLGWRSKRHSRPTILAPHSVVGQDIDPIAQQQSAKQEGARLASHFVTISNRKWRSCQLRTSLAQLNFAAQSSPDGLPAASHQSTPSKCHLPAYLDNSRNFTDDY